MNDEIITTIASGALGNAGILVLGFLQVSQMFFDSKRDSKNREISNLSALVSELRVELDRAKEKIFGLEQQVFSLTQDNARLQGVLESQQKSKEKAIRNYMSKKL